MDVSTVSGKEYLIASHDRGIQLYLLQAGAGAGQTSTIVDVGNYATRCRIVTPLGIVDNSLLLTSGLVTSFLLIY